MKHWFAISLLSLLVSQQCLADGRVLDTITVPMAANENTSAFYVDVNVAGVGETEFLVDTGSSHTVINEESLEKLKHQGTVTYVKDLTGYMADNSKRVVPVYRVDYLDIGGKCVLKDIEVAIFPGNVRQILGLNALGKAAPFMFSMSPPSLALQSCGDRQIVAKR